MTKSLSIFQQEYFLWHNTKNNRVNHKLKHYTSYCYFIFSIIFKSTLLYLISQNALRSWWQQLLGKIWVFAMPKRSNGSYLQENQELKTTCTLSRACQTNVVNKQLVPPLNWNNPFSKTYWWLTYRHVDPEAKYTPM